ncbi:MAG: hypothetical protein R3257_00495, partial [bacterium]|nr:hypothetical protein [bacterium]
MASKVKGPSAPNSSTSAAAPQPTGPVQATPTAKAPPAPADGFSQAAQGLLAYKSSPLASGAMKIFGDNVILPANLTDPNNPANDPKYLRLLSAVLGLDELERYFTTMDEKKQGEYLERKEK